MHTIKRILTSIALAIALATLAAGPAMADTAPNAIRGEPVAEWIFSPSAISVVPAQGNVTIASATFTTTGPTSGTPASATVVWSFDAEASAVFQAQSSSTEVCIINITIPGSVPSTGAGSQGITTPNFSLGATASASAKMVGIQLYAATTYTASATISANGAGCNETAPPLVKFVLKLKVRTP
jgi:hypothetical protein